MKEELKVFLDRCLESRTNSSTHGDEAVSFGFSHYGLTSLGRPLKMDIYKEWLRENYQGDMHYLSEQSAIKENPQTKWPYARSALVFAMPYFPHPEKLKSPLKQARLSLYSQGQDYHFWFRARMNKLIEQLKEKYPDEEFVAMTDSSPVLERDLAYRAQLGWVGKNTCLIHPKKGSLFFIGEIYTSLQVQEDDRAIGPLSEPLPDFCGTCTRCIDICPTQALIEPRKMDARRCISYLNIESRQVPALELRPLMGDWFFGCDLCQTVCPWNQKVFKIGLSTAHPEKLDTHQEQDLVEDLRYILSSSGKKLERDFFGSPLARAGSFGLKRNALVVAGNKKLADLKHEVEALLEHAKLGELAQWTLQEFLKA